jgi:hypothetical protein
MCTFYAPKAPPEFALDFLGYGEIGMILFKMAGTDGPSYLPGGTYEILEFKENDRRIHFVYRNPGDRSLLPSFTLKGASKSVALNVAGSRFVGELNCDY